MPRLICGKSIQRRLRTSSSPNGAFMRPTITRASPPSTSAPTHASSSSTSSSVNFGSNYQGARRGSESAQEVITIPAVWVHEAGVAYSAKFFGRRADLRLNVHNLFDKTYVTTGPFLGEPRVWRFSLRTMF